MAIGAAVGLAASSPGRARRVLAGAAAASAAAVAVLVVVHGRDVLVQAFLFQTIKGSTPLAERVSVFATAAGPWAVLAVGGAVAAGRAAALPAALAAAMTVPWVAAGPTYWSHNAIDACVPMALLGGIGLARARFGRAAAAVAAALVVIQVAAGRLVFLTEGVPRAEIARVAAEVARRSSPGEPVFAPAFVLVEADRPGAIVHPEYLGVYRWLEESLAREGLIGTLRAARRRGFHEAARANRWRWEGEAHAAIEAGAVDVVALLVPPYDLLEDRLEPARLEAAGLRVALSTERFRVWARP